MLTRANFSTLATILLIAPDILYSQPIDCGQVLNENFVNTTSTVVSEQIISKIQTDICNQTFLSQELASERLRSGGWSLDVFGYFENSLVDRTSRTATDYSVRNTEFCNKSSNQLVRSAGTNFLEVNGRFVLEAYESCVETAGGNRLFLTYETHGFGNDSVIAGDLIRTLSNQGSFTYDILGFSVTPSNAGVSCVLGSGDNGTALLATPITTVDRSPVSISCSKSVDVTAVINIQTTEGDFKIVSPSTTEDERDLRMQDLIVDLEALEGAVATLSGADILREEAQQEAQRYASAVSVWERRFNSLELVRTYRGDNPSSYPGAYPVPCSATWQSASTMDNVCRAKFGADFTARTYSISYTAPGGTCDHQIRTIACHDF